jgi:flagellar biosynthetic protein FliR
VRIDAMLMLLPGLGELSIPPRMRLSAALALAILIMPLHRSAYRVDLTMLAPVFTVLAEELPR